MINSQTLFDTLKCTFIMHSCRPVNCSKYCISLFWEAIIQILLKFCRIHRSMLTVIHPKWPQTKKTKNKTKVDE